MKRDTLALFFRQAVIAALPLLGACDTSTIAVGNSDSGVTADLAPVLIGRNCGNTWIVDGGVGDAGCFARCQQPAGGTTGFCAESTNASGQPITTCTQDCTGRRPVGLAAVEVGGRALGAHFARVAHLEAASVPAFRRLRAELRAHGAPRRLLDGCARAARDEVRHARVTSRLARRFGSPVPRVVLARARPRPILALATENVREGCVRESFGALLATWQAATAADLEVRAVMRQLAVDETRHARLAWEIDAWLRGRLGVEERARLEALRQAELAQLGVELERAAALEQELARTIGWPPPVVARALHRSFTDGVASAAV